jgi:hypothetical protein
MLSVVIAATTLAFAPAAPAATPAAPLREIVFKYSYSRKVERSVQQFGSPDMNVGSTNAFAGKLTIDVKQVDAASMILVSATDAVTGTVNMTKPVTGDVVISPSGDVKFVGGDYDEAMTTILPYLSTNYFGNHPLQEGATWKLISLAADKTKTTTVYSVSNVGADTATITSTTQSTGGDASGTSSMETKVVYKAGLLVPLSLDILITSSGDTTTGGRASNQDATTHYHFDRVSDSRDTTGSGG